MEGPFRSSRFDKMLVESGRLLADAGDHERALNELVERLEQMSPETFRRLDAQPPLSAPTGAGTVDRVVQGESHDFLTTIRRLRASAHQQRQRAETLHAGLIGEPASTRQTRSDRPVVLVVDDSKDGLETVALFLELSGFHAITAANGLEALLAAHHARPDVAVLDVAMPVLNGLETARLLKASPVTRSIRLMAYTANWSTDDSALRDAFAEVLAKPASADEFLTTVRHLAAGGTASVS
jgi:CheY-like chemotaxis protein